MVRFSEIKYERPDIEALKALVTEATRKVREAKSASEIRDVYFEVQEAENVTDSMYTVAHIRNTINTADPFYDGEMKWLREELAKTIPQYNAWQKALAESPFRKELEKEFGAQFFRLIDAELMTSDERIVEETIREGELRQAYQKTTAGATTQFRGEQCNFYGLLKHMQSTDRAERREAFEAWAKLYEEISGELEAQFADAVKVRDTKAKKMGFASYTDMAYIARDRFDYTKEDAARFREQVRTTITPAVAEIHEAQRKRLGVDKLRYYDEGLKFPDGNALPIGTAAELVEKARQMYRAMSPETGEFFDFMKEYELYDLETKPGKHMGGYMTRMPLYKAPFIFSNFNGTEADVDVLTHEAGHAFQGYLAMRSIPISALSGSTSEINEVHSMSMEHFAYPWMESFFGENSEKYITAHLFGALCTIPYLVSVDEFQHEVYAKPDMTPMEWRKAWKAIEKKYMPWRDYDGNAFLESGGFWMQKLHIFLYPFYYIEYALAQICAFQYYGRMKTDRKAAWEDYLRLCRAGGTKGYLELLKTGNLLSPFADGTVEKSTSHVIEEIRERYMN
ncbi:MAG: M3 family oligoendopeptidase [Lachnospiraceae bacterium]|nr:M3 family oligoendopeptidase [Lachnospiraceae bacterium]